MLFATGTTFNVPSLKSAIMTVGVATGSCARLPHKKNRAPDGRPVIIPEESRSL
jgi:hypothetical protein